MNNRLTKLRWLVLLAGTIAFLSACNKDNSSAASTGAPAFDAKVVQLQEVESPGYVELTGTLAGSTSVGLSTKLMSQITALNVVEGQRVSAGELLVQIDDSEIQAMRNEAAAFRAEAAAALAEVETVVAQSRAGKAQAEASVAQAEAALADARNDLERVTRLVEEDTLPRVQKEKAELSLKLAEENLSKARSAVVQADAAIEQARSRSPQVEAKKMQASAKDQQAAALQGYSTLKAPFDGVVTHKYFEAGQLTIPGQPILTVEALGGYKVKLGIPENLSASLSLGSNLDVSLEQGDGIARELSGRLSVLGAAADPASHLVNAELELDENSNLLSGQFARVRVPAGTRRQLLLPESCLQQDGELEYVWRVTAGDIVSKAPVEVGERRNGMVEILRGLSSGDRIVQAPPLELFPGARISSNTSPATASAPAADRQDHPLSAEGGGK